nr:hypothetical protein [uncultured Acetatifactor sp.]
MRGLFDIYFRAYYDGDRETRGERFGTSRRKYGRMAWPGRRRCENMGIYVNPGNISFQEAINSKTYVDKSGRIPYTNSVIRTR